MARERTGDGEDAQMMVLTAVILIAAFLALTAMLARVGDLAAQTQLEGSDPLADEVAAIQRGLERIALDYDGTQGDLQAAVEHMERIAAQRGYWVEITVDCGTPMLFTIDVQTPDAYIRVTQVGSATC